MKFYIASKLENAELVRKLGERLKNFGWELTYDWTIHGNVQSLGEKTLEKVTLNELDGVKNADVVIVVLPGGRGTHAELGAALAIGTPVFVWGQTDRDLIQEGYTCSFYWNPSVKRVIGDMLKLEMELIKFAKNIKTA